MNNTIINKEFLNNDKYIILDETNDNIFDNVEISNMYLSESKIRSFGDVTHKTLFNDLEHPFVIDTSNSFTGNVLYINPEYYLKNQDRVDELIVRYINNYKKDNFSLWDLSLIKDRFIDAIVSNPNIKEVSLAEYGSDGYTLTMEHYKKFKWAGIRVGSKYVSDDLKENFDDIIKLNSEKTLIGSFKYRDLIDKKAINLDRKFTNEELYYLKYINSDMVINLDIEDFSHINEVNDRLKELGKDNKIVISLNEKSKVKFNEFLFNNEINDKNIYVITPDNVRVNLSSYLKFEKILYEMIKNTNNLSPFEKYIYAYNVSKQFKIYKENEQNKDDSRKLYSLLVNEYMVCVGYSRLFGDLLSKMGMENMYLGVSVEVSYDDVKDDELEFNEVKVVERDGHARRYVHIVDPKYNIDGYYVSDPTWDNDLEHDYYSHLAMTDKEATLGGRYIFTNYTDIFDVNSIDEFIEKMNRLRSKYHYRDFINEFRRLINVLQDIDINLFNKFKEKYIFIDKTPMYWPDSITDLIYDFGNEIVNKVNKSIGSDTIFKAVESVYRNSYGYSEEELSTKLESVRKENIERHKKQFPTRYRINLDGSSEIIMNEENKFESVRKM